MTGAPVHDDEDDLMTSDEVAARLLSVAPLRRLAVSCVIPAVRHGDEWRFRRKDLEAWIRKQKRRLSAPSGKTS
jgi:excisionase family DNA binding protein